MNKNVRMWIYSVLLTGLCLVLFSACEKDGKNNEDDKGTAGIVFNPDKTYGTLTDIDGNVYKTIVIGTQTWMAENLKTIRYANGNEISHITDPTPWGNATSGAWTYYYNNNEMDAHYGKLYNWLAVEDPRNICPAGWHIPDDPEWETLLAYLGGYQVAGAKMKETSLNHWAFSNEGSTNVSGFTGLPGGMRDYGSLSFDKGLTAYFWSSTNASDYYDLEAYYYYLSRDMDAMLDGAGDKNNGASCRCVKD
jgi:uncharacterized protein (TIGR02145 family)